MDFIQNKKYSYHKALLEWCQNDPRFLAELYIHKSRGKHVNQRKKFKLNNKEIKFITQYGLIKIREDISNYINIIIKNPNNKEKFDLQTNHPINVAKIATGLCCRICLNECYNIKEWIILTEEQVDNYSMLMMKWIHQEFNPQ